jgi:hypothetical protein
VVVQVNERDHAYPCHPFMPSGIHPWPGQAPIPRGVLGQKLD